MPTYTVWSEADTISIKSRAAIASVLTEAHHAVTGAPRYFAQVLFPEVQKGSVFVGGRALTEGHIWVRADIRSGRTADQKRTLIDRVMEEIGNATGVAQAHIWVYINEISGENMSEWGQVLPQPGGEDRWHEALPEEIKETLRDLT